MMDGVVDDDHRHDREWKRNEEYQMMIAMMIGKKRGNL